MDWRRLLCCRHLGFRRGWRFFNIKENERLLGLHGWRAGRGESDDGTDKDVRSQRHTHAEKQQTFIRRERQ